MLAYWWAAPVAAVAVAGVFLAAVGLAWLLAVLADWAGADDADR